MAEPFHCDFSQRLCTPSEMVAIRNVLREIGLPELEFDGYLKQYNWSD